MLSAQPVRTEALLQAVHAADDSVVWVAGHDATWAVTRDGGIHWRVGTVPGAEGLEFRDVWAAGPDTAVLLSSGPGDRSRIYRTVDGGRSWSLQFASEDSAAFYDCLDFWDSRHGLAFSDGVGGRFPLLTTSDGVRWKPASGEGAPAARPGEGGFAASGDCLTLGPDGRAWIGTGAVHAAARVLRSTDGGRSWASAGTPLPSGPQAGVMAVAFRDARHGVAVGGDLARLARPDTSGVAAARGGSVDAGGARRGTADGSRGSAPGAFEPARVALSDDGGATWTRGGSPTFAGPVFGVAWVPGAPTPTLVAVGPGGASYSTDAGRSWTSLDTAASWSVAFAAPDAGWLVGPNGRIARAGIYGGR